MDYDKTILYEFEIALFLLISYRNSFFLKFIPFREI